MIRLSFTGDVMCEHTRLETYKTDDNKYDFSPVFSDLKEDFSRSDLVVANLETPLAGEELKYSWRKYQFNTPDEFGVAMKEAGIHFVSTANNHVLDRGIEGLDRTLDTLDRIGLKHTGSFRNEHETKPIILDIKGCKIAILSYTYGTEAPYNHHYLKENEQYKVNLLKNQELSNPIRRSFYTSKKIFPRALRAVYRRVLPKYANRGVGELKEADKKQKLHLSQDISYAKQNSDYVIMCLHCGGQYETKPIKYTRQVVNSCLAQGVNAVIGNHEHRIQESRLDDHDKLVTYCLGNYSGGAGVERPPYDKGADCSILFHIYIDEENKKVSSVSFGVLISVKNDQGQIITKRLYDHYQMVAGQQKEELYRKNLQAVNDFLGTSFDEIEIKEEYNVPELIGRTLS